MLEVLVQTIELILRNLAVSILVEPGYEASFAGIAVTYRWLLLLTCLILPAFGWWTFGSFLFTDESVAVFIQLREAFCRALEFILGNLTVTVLVEVLYEPSFAAWWRAVSLFIPGHCSCCDEQA